jgi:hypothetical protein
VCWLGDGYTSLDLLLICFWPNDEVDCEVPLGKVAAVITSKISLSLWICHHRSCFALVLYHRNDGGW